MPAEMEMAERGPARERVEVRWGDMRSGGSFDARVTEGAVVEGGGRHHGGWSRRWRGQGEVVPAEMEMVGRGPARGRMEVRWGDIRSGGSFDARVTGEAAVEGGAAPWWLKQRKSRSW